MTNRIFLLTATLVLISTLAINLMKQARPDLMLLDWRLPGMSGAGILDRAD